MRRPVVYLQRHIYATGPVAELCRVRSRYWSDDDAEAAGGACAAADLVFALRGQAIPCDYAAALAQSVTGLLPWLSSVPQAGLRLALGAESANGWQRDESDGALIYLPRRTRLVLRLPVQRLEAARALAGRTLEVGGLPLRVGEPRVVALAAGDTLYARHVIDVTGDEQVFLERLAQAIEALGPRPRRIMCGRSRHIGTPDRALCTRSVLLASLAPRDALTLLATGLGPGRLLGCGLFVAYKRPDSLARDARH